MGKLKSYGAGRHSRFRSGDRKVLIGRSRNSIGDRKGGLSSRSRNACRSICIKIYGSSRRPIVRAACRYISRTVYCIIDKPVGSATPGCIYLIIVTCVISGAGIYFVVQIRKLDLLFPDRSVVKFILRAAGQNDGSCRRDKNVFYSIFIFIF